jgi:hypothetical protein
MSVYNRHWQADKGETGSPRRMGSSPRPAASTSWAPRAEPIRLRLLNARGTEGSFVPLGLSCQPSVSLSFPIDDPVFGIPGILDDADEPRS